MKKRTQKERVRALRKRRDYLVARIEASNLDLSFDKEERDALTWALPILEQYIAIEALKRAKEGETA